MAKKKPPALRKHPGPKGELESHPDRRRAIQMIAEGVPNTRIAKEFSVTEASVRRFINSCLSDWVSIDYSRRNIDDAGFWREYMLDLFEDLERMRVGLRKELQDPDDPGAYSMSPRAWDEVTVVYRTYDEKGKVVERRARLQELVNMVQLGLGLKVATVETSTTDIRIVMLRTLNQSLRQVARYQEMHQKAENVGTDAAVRTLWGHLQAAILKVTDGKPALRAKITEIFRLARQSLSNAS